MSETDAATPWEQHMAEVRAGEDALRATIARQRKLLDDFARIYANVDHRNDDETQVALFQLWVRVVGPAPKAEVKRR
jgi:hypothetical protein